jgi:hypothetical protein
MHSKMVRQEVLARHLAAEQLKASALQAMMTEEAPVKTASKAERIVAMEMVCDAVPRVSIFACSKYCMGIVKVRADSLPLPHVRVANPKEWSVFKKYAAQLALACKCSARPWSEVARREGDPFRWLCL